MIDFDAVVIGAGVIGLAIARSLAQSGRSVIVLESAGAIGTSTSSRSSEVIHSGIYYPPQSLKAKLCLEGRQQIYEFCKIRNLPHARCGKIIVATNENEQAAIEIIAKKAIENGVNDLQWLSPKEVGMMEPELFCISALFSPSTGILDSHAFMLALQGDAENYGATIAFFTPFLRAKNDRNKFLIETGGREPTKIKSSALINCAGLEASRVASLIEGLSPIHIPVTYLAKGNYFALNRHNPFKKLIYPAPQLHGLGVHLTFDLNGSARFGPDVEWIDAVDYHVNPRRSDDFYDAIRKYWPQLPNESLTPAYSGIRPKISSPNDSTKDFRIDGAVVHSMPGLINLFGIESPGLTSSLAIAEHVSNLLDIDIG